MAAQPCLFCGGDRTAPDHAAHCDGRQGAIEAAAEDRARAARLPAFDLPAGRVARDAAIARVDAHAGDTFKDAALLAIERVARQHGEFTTEAVWRELGAERPAREPRALGAVMQTAHRAGLIEPTERWQQSALVRCHARPCRVWRSRVYRAA